MSRNPNRRTAGSGNRPCNFPSCQLRSCPLRAGEGRQVPPVEQDLQLEPLSGSVTEGQAAGTLTLTQNGTELASVELVSAENEEAPNPLSWILVQFDRLVRFVSGQPTAAETVVYAEAPVLTELDAA